MEAFGYLAIGNAGPSINSVFD